MTDYLALLPHRKMILTITSIKAVRCIEEMTVVEVGVFGCQVFKFPFEDRRFLPSLVEEKLAQL